MENLNQYNVVYFSTSTCPPCKASKPLILKASIENNINTRFFTIDEEKDGRDVASDYKIRAVPTLLFFKNGEEVFRISGGMDGEKFINLCKQHI